MSDLLYGHAVVSGMCPSDAPWEMFTCLMPHGKCSSCASDSSPDTKEAGGGCDAPSVGVVIAAVGRAYTRQWTDPSLVSVRLTLTAACP